MAWHQSSQCRVALVDAVGVGSVAHHYAAQAQQHRLVLAMVTSFYEVDEHGFEQASVNRHEERPNVELHHAKVIDWQVLHLDHIGLEPLHSPVHSVSLSAVVGGIARIKKPLLDDRVDADDYPVLHYSVTEVGGIDLAQSWTCDDEDY